MKNSFNTPLTASTTNTWITPREILRELGHFDLDPCAATNQPWPCADQSYTAAENGLIQPWKGRIRFCREDGTQGAAPNAASVLVAWAADEISLLKSLEAKGLGKIAILKTQH